MRSALALSISSCSLLLDLDETRIRREPPPVEPVERCDEPGDEDGDGLTDCRDPDCHAVAACTFPFEVDSELEIFATSLVIADFDGDGFEDLAGGLFPGLDIAYGAAIDPFARIDSLELPAPSSFALTPAVADFDADGATDVAYLDMSSLYVAFGGRDRRLRSPIIPSFVRARETRTAVLRDRRRPAGWADVLEIGETDGGARLSFVEGGGALVLELPPVTNLLPPAALDIDKDGDGAVVLAFLGSSTVFVVGRDNGSPAVRQIVTLPLPAFGRPHAADLDGDGTLDLIIAMERGLGVALGAPTTGLFDAPCATPLEIRRDGNVWIVQAPSVFDVADFDGDGLGDLVSELGILSLATPFRCVGALDVRLEWSPRPYEAGVAGDFNGDGHADAVFFNGASLELVLGSDVGFNGKFLAGVWEPGPMAAGDFDGDFADDVGFFDQFTDTITTIFGSRDGRMDDVTVTASVTEVTAMTPLTFQADGDQDVETDLSITAGREPTRITLVRGGSSRVMSSAAIVGGDERLLTERFVLSGRFCGRAPAGRNLFAVRLDPTLREPHRAGLWLGAESQEVRDGFIEASSATLAGSIATYRLAFAVADIEGDGRDEILAVDGECPTDQACVRVIQFDDGCEIRASEPLELPGVPLPGMGAPMTLAVADVDADGHVDLISWPSVGPGELRVTLGDGRTFARTETLPTETAVLSVVSFQGDGDPELELAVARYENSVWIVGLDSSGDLEKTHELGAGLDITMMAAGDVDLDELDDLVVGDGESELVLLGIDRTGTR